MSQKKNKRYKHFDAHSKQFDAKKPTDRKSEPNPIPEEIINSVIVEPFNFAEKVGTVVEAAEKVKKTARKTVENVKKTATTTARKTVENVKKTATAMAEKAPATVKKLIQSSTSKVMQPMAVQMLKSGVEKDVKKSLDSYINSTSYSISNVVDATNAATVLSEQIMTKVTNTLSKSIEENLKLSHDLLKCKDAKDILNFHQKLFETNFNTSMSFYTDVNYLLQTFATKHIDISSKYLAKNMKGFNL